MIGGSLRSSIFKLALYYTLFAAVGLVLAAVFPELRALVSWDGGAQAGLSQLGQAIRTDSVLGGGQAVATSAVRTLSVMVGALILAAPIAWVYMRTKQEAAYDESVVHTVIILPIAVAGIVMIVRESIALAFSLAGIVAAVRFRNTLKDTKDAVYIFLAIGIGLAAGVGALVVAFVMSVVYALTVLTLWRFNIGDLYDTQRGRESSQVEARTTTTMP